MRAVYHLRLRAHIRVALTNHDYPCIVRRVNTAERIKRARKNAGMTQDQLARAAGVAPITVSRWERDAHQPLPHQYRRVADATGVSLAELVAPEADEA